jgi:DNA-binding transcriptional LysR family regulator
MINKEVDWNLYRTFLAVVRTGSLSAAARMLASTQPTVGRQLETLEAALGQKLFTRSQRGLLPTAAAKQLLIHAECMDTAAAALRRTSKASELAETGTVRLTTGAQIGLEVLPKMLADFSHQHPRIELELSISSQKEDLLNRDADIAIRMSRPSQQALVARRVGKVRIALFARRSYLAMYGAPQSKSELARHRLIGFDKNTEILKSFAGPSATMRREDFAFRTDNVTAQLALLRAGIGIAACHTHVAQRDSELIPVLPDHVSFEREIWLAMHADLKRARHVRLLFDHLQRQMTDYLGSS